MSVTLSSYAEDKGLHGFKLIEKRFVKEVNAECLYFEHVKSGAKLFKIAAKDNNKTFCISFKTEPNSDCGTPHIIEHAVLNGSKKFTAKSPFDELLKGSLKTFLNAMTGQDYTMFPIASMNEKDYFNLMDVYLDAVFNPVIYNDPRILKQEGWHYELTSPESQLTIKGVVYNEMKGAFSSPLRELSYQIYKNLFPDNGYRFSSGGHPEAIPTLTQEAFVNYHKQFYNPSNAYIVLYGDADLNKELEFIDREYLSKFNKQPQKETFTIQKPSGNVKEVEAKYPVTGGSNLSNKTYLNRSYVIGLNTDLKLSLALDVLADVLVNQESAPLRLALQKAGIGQDVRASVNNIRQNVLSIVAINANAEDKDKFLEIVKSTLAEICKNGLSKEAVEGSINRTEFALREGNDAQKGLTYAYQIKNNWMNENDPFAGIQWEKPLAELKKSVDQQYLEQLIQKEILDNNHSVMVILKPEPDLEKTNNAVLASKLETYKASLTPDQINDLVKDTKALVEFQKRQDSPENLATIPKLSIKDIDPEADWYQWQEKEISGKKLVHYEDFTNNVVYVRFMFNLKVLPEGLLPYAPLLAELLGKMNAGKYNYTDLNNQLNIHTGGFSASLASYLENLDDAALIPEFVVSAKAMNNKTTIMTSLMAEIVNKTDFTDKERLKNLLSRYQSRLESRIKNTGEAYAVIRLSAYYSNQGMFREITEGIENYKFINTLAKNFDVKADEIIANLQKAASLIFNKHNLLPALTCDKKDYETSAKAISEFTASLGDKNIPLNNWQFKRPDKNEGIVSASKVQYVYKGFDIKKLGYEWNGKIRVLNQAISRDWLQTQVRVIGGAYGGRAVFAPSGNTYFFSYRDPNLTETLVNFDSTANYLRNFNANDEEMTKFIIGTISSMDMPLTQQEKGNLALMRYMQKTSREFIQAERKAVLETTAQDIRNMEKLVRDIMKQNFICVYGNKEKIESVKDIFSNLIDVEM